MVQGWISLAEEKDKWSGNVLLIFAATKIWSELIYIMLLIYYGWDIFLGLNFLPNFRLEEAILEH